MERLFINKENLNIDNIDGSETRVKAFLRNSNNEVLMIHNNYTYQLPGGHQLKDETLEDSLKRELSEETGITVEQTIEPFMMIREYNKNFLNTGKNICNTIYYYSIESDELPNGAKLNLTELESRTKLKFYYIKISELEEFIKKEQKNKRIEDMIAFELLEVIKVYKNLVLEGENL
ncbi:MAG: NUDIX hydrolase [Bacilli bacterium]|nr:NUDIX hydrolase [Bacilli bacterium]